jgi:hypothetical protein
MAQRLNGWMAQRLDGSMAQWLDGWMAGQLDSWMAWQLNSLTTPTGRQLDNSKSLTSSTAQQL